MSDTVNELTQESNYKYYNYKTKKTLNKDIDDYLNLNVIDRLYICGYEVNTDAKYPFLKFLLTNNIETNELSLPSIPITNTTSQVLANFAQIYLYNILLLSDSDDFLEKIVIDGFYEFENKLFLFVDLTKYQVNLPEVYSSQPTRFALIDEICNSKHVCNIPIDQYVTYFFTMNSYFCYLYDENHDTYEIPTVLYVGLPEHLINFTYFFGVSPKDKTAILGPYYYFTSFKSAIKYGGWSESGKPEYKSELLLTDNEYGRYIKGGVIRNAVFLGNSKYIENNQNDPIDTSETKKYKLNNEIDNKFERLTMRITDYDGLWSSSYDSCYLGRIELDNGDCIKDPILVVKNFNQHIPLSYHYINKKSLGDVFDYTKIYKIL